VLGVIMVGVVVWLLLRRRGKAKKASAEGAEVSK